MGKTIKFTNNDLAKAMGLEVGKKYCIDGAFLQCVMDCGEIMLVGGVNKRMKYYPISVVGYEVKELPETPKLTEQEITILKGRQAEGFDSIGRNAEGGIRFFKNKCGYSSAWCDEGLFSFVKDGVEFYLRDLLKGNE